MACIGAVRFLLGTSLLDREDVVSRRIVNTLAVRRDISELPRVIDALQQPDRMVKRDAGWQKGRAGITPADRGAAKYLAEHWDTL